MNNHSFFGFFFAFRQKKNKTPFARFVSRNAVGYVRF